MVNIVLIATTMKYRKSVKPRKNINILDVNSAKRILQS